MARGSEPNVISVSVPANTAYLGCAFVCGAIAVGLHLRVSATFENCPPLTAKGGAPTPASTFKLAYRGPNADQIPLDGRNLIVKSMQHYAARAGVSLPGAQLDIENENDFDIETDSITYQLFANTSSTGENWQPILQRSYTQRIVIEEDKITRVDIPIEFNYSDLSGAARTILDRGMLNYRIQGQAFVREPLRRTVPFTKTGSVSMAGAR